MASVLSYPDAAAEVMEHLCSHDGDGGHGYSQINRQGVGTGATSFEPLTLSDGTGIRIATGDRDCSSAAKECYAALGVDCGGASYTGNMRSCMVASGNFKWIAPYSASKVRRGDILLAEGRHAAVGLGNGKLGQFSISERGTTHGKRGDQTRYESNIKALYDYPWDGILRYCGPAREGSEAPSEGVAVPPTESTGGIDLGSTDWWGPKFTREIQRQRGTTVDGVVSYQPPSNREYLPNCEADSWQFTDGWEDGGGSDVVRSVQRLTGATVDGWAGREFAAKLQTWLEARGFDIGPSGVDGSIGPDTCRAVAAAIVAGAFKI